MGNFLDMVWGETYLEGDALKCRTVVVNFLCHSEAETANSFPCSTVTPYAEISHAWAVEDLSLSLSLSLSIDIYKYSNTFTSQGMSCGQLLATHVQQSVL